MVMTKAIVETLLLIVGEIQRKADFSNFFTL